MSYTSFHFLYARVQSQKLLNLPKDRTECDLASLPGVCMPHMQEADSYFIYQ